MSDHEQQEAAPAIEAQVSGQCPNIIEKVNPSAELFAYALIVGIGQFQYGVHQKGKKIQRRQHCGETLFAVSEVMRQVIAFCFQGVIVFIFDLLRVSTINDGYTFTLIDGQKRNDKPWAMER